MRTQAVGSYGSGYSPPTSEALRTTLLDAAANDVTHGMASLSQQRNLFGYTLTSDGWSSVQNKPLLNALVVVPAGAEFVQASDTSGETKSSQYIAKNLSEVRGKQGAQQCDLVITDGAAACKAAGQELEQE